MATLTEKEITVIGSGANIELFAQYRDGKVTEVYALLDIDGARLSGNDHLGYIVYEDGRFTSFCLSLMSMLSADLSVDFYNQLNILIKG